MEQSIKVKESCLESVYKLTDLYRYDSLPYLLIDMLRNVYSYILESIQSLKNQVKPNLSMLAKHQRQPP